MPGSWSLAQPPGAGTGGAGACGARLRSAARKRTSRRAWMAPMAVAAGFVAVAGVLVVTRVPARRWCGAGSRGIVANSRPHLRQRHSAGGPGAAGRGLGAGHGRRRRQPDSQCRTRSLPRSPPAVRRHLAAGRAGRRGAQHRCRHAGTLNAARCHRSAWRGRGLAGGCLMAVACCCRCSAHAGTSGAAHGGRSAAEARGWLQRIHSAASQRNYQGTLVVSARRQRCPAPVWRTTARATSSSSASICSMARRGASTATTIRC